MISSKYRIDEVSYANGAHQCIVIDRATGYRLYRSALYRREDREGTVPVFRALRAAQDFIERLTKSRMRFGGPPPDAAAGEGKV